MGGTVVLDPNIILLEEFSNIIMYGKKKKDEELSNKMLLYIYYCCDLTEENTMRDLDFRIKEGQALSRALGSSKKKTFNATEKKLIDAGLDAYNFFNETALERVAQSYDKKIDTLRTEFDNIKFVSHEVTDDDHQVIRIVSNEKIIANLGKQIVELADYKLRAMEAARKMENKGRVRGDKGSSAIERLAFLTDEEKADLLH
jgi:hypothetical protein